MFHRGRVAQAAVAAGLGIAMAFGPVIPAMADTGNADTPVVGESANPEYDNQTAGESTGDTKLYVIGKQDDLTTSEGSKTENIKVSIPVAIHYVADSQGNLTGPTNNTVKFVNHTVNGAVHVSKIAVQDAGSAHVVEDSNSMTNDQVSFFVQPVQGQSDESGDAFTAGTATEGNDTDFVKTGTKDQLGKYASKTHDAAVNPTNKNDWNIAQKHGALALNNLTGRIGGFGQISPSTDYQVGTVHWTVRAGTRAQADVKDATVSIHFNANDGTNANCVPIADQNVVVLQTSQLPEKVADSSAMNTALSAGAADVTPPKSYTDANGNVVSKTFVGWTRSADGSGALVTKISDLGQAEAIAGEVFELYAKYE
ncbi:MAG: hypothetical protein Q4A07_00930 [Coriobacteriales bacterium]|nr:hypothetical protein [Coriobacteriales bacterium]